MNNEIKEIIHLVNKCYKDYYIDDILSGEDVKKLCDYITNLQEENKKLKSKFKTENKALNDMDDIAGEYQNRIDKAIRTLETLRYSARWERHLYEVDYLLNILRGEDK